MDEDKRRNVNDVPVERRLFPRLAVSVDIKYNILKKETAAQEKTVTKNLSAGGICLIVYENIKPGTLLALKIHLSDIDQVIETKGRVVWSSYFTLSTDKRERYDLGVEFTEIGESDRQKISQYVFRLT